MARKTTLLISALLTLTATGAFADVAAAQVDPEQLERLRKEQQEILRKSERLEALMQRLKTRYEREGKKEQVDLLEAGLQHIQEAQLLRDAASIRDDLSATAFSEAVRKQRNVVQNLEKLLDILLDRRSVESIAELEKLAAERALAARELEKRQRELQQATNDALMAEPTAAERELLDQLGNLADRERGEAERNNRDAGMRRPFLESALDRVNKLLDQSGRLDRALEEEAGTRQSTQQQRQFDLGELIQQTRDLARDVRNQERQRELGEAATEFGRQTEGNDTTAVQQSKNRLEALANDAPKIPDNGLAGERTDPKWAELGKELRSAPTGETEAERQELGDLAKRGQELANERGEETTARNIENGERLAERAKAIAEQLDAEHRERQAEANAAAGGEPEEPPKAGEKGSPAGKSPAGESLTAAAEALEKARESAAQGDTQKARQQVDRALTQLERARRQHSEANPDAEQLAARMAAESKAAAEELANSPSAESAEQQASDDLQQAAETLRDIQNQVQKARQEGNRTDATAAAENARDDLEQAKATLEQALEQATEGREADLQAAAERQQELAEQAKAAAEAMRDAVENGQLSPQQAKQAQQAMKSAQQSMQQAAESLQNGQQSNAAQQQEQAADQLQQAAQQMQQNRPMNEAQKEQLAAEAKRQEELKDDIVQLAKMLEEQEQQRAKQKLDEAAEAAQRAQEAMERGDQEETREQQEEARKKLEEAAQELEEERDRYQDLRQEELLFKMKEELLAFLEKQRPITQQTKEAQQVAENGRLSRPMRRKLNQLGEEEFELATRIDFLVQALTDEGNMVYQTVLRSNFEDLREIGDRLSGRRPDVGSFTTLMQEDVERRSEDLLAALEREQKRREQERKEKQEQQGDQQGENKFNPQRERLVGLIAELEMLKQLLADTERSNRDLHLLISSRGDERITESEGALVERLAHRHAEITKLFLAIKAAVEETMQSMQDQQGGGQDGEDRGR